VGIPLFIGAATGNLIAAVAFSGGAVTVGLTDSGGPYRGRVRSMLITCVSVAVATFVGQLAGHSGALVVVLLAIASFGAGMFIALGLPTYFVALMTPLTITIVYSAPTDAAHALGRAALVFGGGLFAIAPVVLRRGASVRAELRGAVDLATSWQGEGEPPPDPVRHTRARRSQLGLRRPGPILRANLTLRSSAFRHAVRLSVTVAIAAAIAQIFDLPRGYWIPLTVLFVLRPDFGSTFTRGLQRYAGTALGVVLATLLTAALHPGPYALAALITVLAFAFCALLFANYGLFTLSVTAFIIFYAAYAGAHNEYATALDRLVDTTIGATLTLGIYALWPTWERVLLPDTCAELIEADRAYVRALFDSWFRRGEGRGAVAAARARARLARTNTEASVQRAMLEPAAKRIQFGTDRAAGVSTSLRRFADGALALEAYLEDDPPAAPPEARALADQLDRALAELARAAHAHQAPNELPPLHETQQALAAQVGPATPAAEESDRMVNSLIITAHVLGAPSADAGAQAAGAAVPMPAPAGG
jgi:uncharacterized membrane protein YccC